MARPQDLEQKVSAEQTAEQTAQPDARRPKRPGLIAGIVVLVGVVAVLATAIIVIVGRSDSPRSSAASVVEATGTGSAGTGSAASMGSHGSATSQHGVGSASVVAGGTQLSPGGALLRLFATDALCQQYGTVGCERGRALAAACERNELAACRGLLAMFSLGQFADLAMAKAVTELLCRRGTECERRDQLIRFTNASLNFADHVDARAACRAGDALACATAGLSYGNNIPQRLEWAERACALGVATRGGCIEITALAPTLVAKLAALQRACDAGSAQACGLVGKLLTDKTVEAPLGVGNGAVNGSANGAANGDSTRTPTPAQKAQAARALQRCCTLAPGAQCCGDSGVVERPE